MLGFVLTIAAFFILIEQQYSSNQLSIIIAISIIAICFLVEWVYKFSEKRKQ